MANERFSVEGRSVLVTGATGALGRTAAIALAAAGARLTLAGANGPALTALAGELAAERPEDGRDRWPVATVELRPESEADADSMVRAAVAAHGRLDGVLVASGMNKVGLITDLPLADFEAVMDANVRGSWLVCKAAGRQLLAQGEGGSVVLVSSTRGRLGHPAGYSAYCPSKAAVDLLAKTLAAEWGKAGIRVNALAPTVFRSELTAWMYADDEKGRATREAMLSRIPLGRLAEPEDFNGALIYLLSQASAFLTGQVLYLDGGYTGMLSRVGVLGAGLMGRGIAGVLVAAGHDVVLYDADATVLDDALRQLTDEGLPVAPAGSVPALAVDADLVVEAVVENLALKQELFAELDRANPTALLATNTSVLPVSAIARRTDRPGRVVGTHWWNPPRIMPLVEVVRGEHTTDSTMDQTVDFLRRLGKLPVRVERDVPGFVGNRLQHALWREAIALVADGVCDARTVDLVVRNTIGLRLAEVGPIENADYVGLDLTLAIHEAVLPDLSSSPGPSPLLRQLVTSGRLGAKAGQGFLDWPPGAREAVAHRLNEHVARQLDRRAG